MGNWKTASVAAMRQDESTAKVQRARTFDELTLGTLQTNESGWTILTMREEGLLNACRRLWIAVARTALVSFGNRFEQRSASAARQESLLQNLLEASAFL